MITDIASLHMWLLSLVNRGRINPEDAETYLRVQVLVHEKINEMLKESSGIIATQMLASAEVFHAMIPVEVEKDVPVGTMPE